MLKSKGGSKGSGGPADKKQTIMAVVAIVVILGVGAIFAKNFIGGSDGGDSYSAETSMPADSGAPAPGAPASGTPAPNASAQPAPTAGAQTPGAQSAPAPGTPAAQPAPAPAPSARRAASAKTDAPAAPTKQIKVFNTVNVTYPSSWKIDASVASHAAVFTNGTGSFEIRTPAPKADSAKAIAEAALKTYTPGGVVAAQGADKIAGNDAYWFAVSFGSQTIRVVGVDAPTRVVLLARAPRSVYSAYRSKFDSMQKSLTF